MYLIRLIAALSLLLTMITSSDALAQPTDPEEQSNRPFIELPSGWYLVRIIEGGWLMEHEDGSRVRIIQCAQSDHYRVAWLVTYTQGDLNCIASLDLRVSDQTATISDTRIRLRVEPDGRRQILGIFVPWPEQVVQAFLETLNPETRYGICTR
ncbi:hypothetical protein KKF05_03225 [Patescibacteria group bacterium]|nr:hypothetical protein [Patescibacteria group bacterium]MBU1028867.1 hypothetical protein [Patescibacteria group bacterium]MBU1915640.1 hypothetical protein [Patescibacteria group bacterium]